MSKFEQYLISLGFEKMVLNAVTGELKPAGNTILSTLGCIAFCYVHEKYGRVFYGLSEYGKPPTLVSPRPRIYKIFKTENGSHIFFGYDSDDLMNIVLSKYTPEEIFEAMYDHTKTFVIKDEQ